eukprot:COSAG01_NODE_21575_length_895_cov_2.405779_1_plen_100_part_10
MGPPNYENVGKSQPVLIVINPMISPRISVQVSGARELEAAKVRQAVETAGGAGAAGAGKQQREGGGRPRGGSLWAKVGTGGKISDGIKSTNASAFANIAN